MGPTIDERLLKKKYDLWVSKLESQQQQAAKPKATQDAEEARKKKAHAAALSAFKAAQARQGVNPLSTARTAQDRQDSGAGSLTNATPASPGRAPVSKGEAAAIKPKVRSLADDLEEDDNSPPARTMPASTTERPASKQDKKPVADHREQHKGPDSKPPRVQADTKRGNLEKGRDKEAPSHKRSKPDERTTQDMAPPHKRRYEEPAQRDRAQLDTANKQTAADTSRQQREQGGSAQAGRAPPARPRPSQQQRNQRAMLFVGDLPIGTSDEDLSHAFSRFGALASTRVVPNKCFGFVEFRDEGVAQALLSQQQHDVRIQGREVRIAPSSGPLPEWKKGPTVLVQGGGDGYGAMAYVTQGASLNDQVGGPKPRTTNMAPPPRLPVGAPDLPDERKPIVYDDI